VPIDFNRFARLKSSDTKIDPMKAPKKTSGLSLYLQDFAQNNREIWDFSTEVQSQGFYLEDFA
jgi:hypothetical protein